MSLIIDSFATFPIDSIPNLIVHLDSTSFSNGTNFITNPTDPVVIWKNKVKNTITGATQSVASRRPLLKTATLDGKLEAKFDGVDDFLTFGSGTELAFPRNKGRSIFILTGENTVEGALIHRGGATDRQYGMFYYTGGIDWFNYYCEYYYGSHPAPNRPTLVSMIYRPDNTFDGYENRTKIADNMSVGCTTTTTYDTLLGARQNGSNTAWAFYNAGSYRTVLIFDRDLTNNERDIIFNELIVPE